ncbi:MAG: mechanosensitive ion channel family protein [Nitriliruptorales bacterium]|nr:mechanosensitive ion channel family protein [Nitriliruptorales bacterium]
MSHQLFVAFVEAGTPAPAEPSIPARGEPTPSPLTEWLADETGWEWIEVLGANIIEPIFESIVIILLAWIASWLVRRSINKMVEEAKDPETTHRLGLIKKRVRIASLQEGDKPYTPRRERRAEALGALGRSIASGTIWLIAVFMVLGAFEVNLGPLIAGAGIVGVALGFGAQSLVKDFLSGVFMLIEDQYGVGDIVDVGEAAGVVEGVGLRTTRVRSVDGTLWHVPNGEILRVGNKSQQWARALLDISVAYGSDADRAGEVIKQVADEMYAEEPYNQQFLEEPELWGIENLGPDGVDIRLVIKTQPGDQYKLMRELRRRIKIALDDAGIEIPFPQRTIWVRSETGEPQENIGG